MDLTTKGISYGNIAVAGGARDPRNRVSMVVKENIGLLRECIDPPPGDLFLSVQIGLYPKDLLAVGLHHRVAAHAKRDAWNSGLAVPLGAGVAERTLDFLLYVRTMAERNRLVWETLARARNMRYHTPKQLAAEGGEMEEPARINLHKSRMRRPKGPGRITKFQRRGKFKLTPSKPRGAKTRKTDAGDLQSWLNQDVVEIFKQHHALDSEGIFIGDASYLFVPDNSNYEDSSLLLFDEHNHPVDKEKEKELTPKQRARCRWRRCYKLVSLIHTNRAGEFFLYAGLEVTSGKGHECPILCRQTA